MYTNAIENYLKQHSYHHIHLKAVLFDMDGVLFNSMPNHARAWNEAMKHYGMHLSCEEAYLHEGRTGASTINIVSQRERGHDATPEEIERIYHTKTEIFNSYPKAERMPGAWEAIRQMKADGLTIMVVTGSGQASLLERHLPSGTHGDRLRCKTWKAQSRTLSDGFREGGASSQ